MQAKVTFHKIIQDSQELGSDDQHMVSRVFFDLEVGGQLHTGLYSDLKQIVGSDIETAPLEVGAPQGYSGPFNHEAFTAEVEKYYRKEIGSSGSAIRIAKGSKVRMRDNTIICCVVVYFKISKNGGGW